MVCPSRSKNIQFVVWKQRKIGCLRLWNGSKIWEVSLTTSCIFILLNNVVHLIFSPLPPYSHEVITLWYRPLELLFGSRIYSTPVDMWSCGCIMGEILMRKPLFPGEGEIDQITKICRVLGAPTEDNWPGVSQLPNSNKVILKSTSKGKLRELFPGSSFSGGICLSELGFDLLSKLLILDPKQRLSARNAVDHLWFQESPAPCPLELMPQFSSRHEIRDNIEEK